MVHISCETPRWFQNVWDWMENTSIDGDTFIIALNYLQNLGIAECFLNGTTLV